MPKLLAGSEPVWYYATMNPLKPDSLIIDRSLLRQLVYECKVMRTRVQAIVACDSALNSLCEDDVFGASYSRLLASDRRALHLAASAGERVLNETIEV